MLTACEPPATLGAVRVILQLAVAPDPESMQLVALGVSVPLPKVKLIVPAGVNLPPLGSSSTTVAVTVTGTAIVTVLLAKLTVLVVWRVFTVRLGALLLPECTLSVVNVPVMECSPGLAEAAVNVTEQLAVAPLPDKVQLGELKPSLGTPELKVMVPAGVTTGPLVSVSVTVNVTVVG